MPNEVELALIRLFKARAKAAWEKYKLALILFDAAEEVIRELKEK